MILIINERNNTNFISSASHEQMLELWESEDQIRHNLSPSFPKLDESKYITHWGAEQAAVDFLFAYFKDFPERGSIYEVAKV